MKNLNTHLGYLSIDHRDSPGVSPEFVKQVEQQSGKTFITGPPGQLYESDLYSCSHCQATVIKNPLRTRPRHYCAKCDAYICDGCAVLGECRPFVAVIDQTLESAVKRSQEV